MVRAIVIGFFVSGKSMFWSISTFWTFVLVASVRVSCVVKGGILVLSGLLRSRMGRVVVAVMVPKFLY